MDDIDGLLLMTGRLFEFKDTFNEITKKMKKEMKDFDLTERKEFNVRDCCAVYNDGQWKRGMVERVNSQNYQGWCSKKVPLNWKNYNYFIKYFKCTLELKFRFLNVISG